MAIGVEGLHQPGHVLAEVAASDRTTVAVTLKHPDATLLAQLSENGELTDVFSELLDGVGTEIVMRPLARYAPQANGSLTVSYSDIVRSAREQGESAIGFHIASGSAGRGVVVNDDQVRALVPAGVRGTVEDIANAVCFLASPASSNMTGEFVRMDAGMHLVP